MKPLFLVPLFLVAACSDTVAVRTVKVSVPVVASCVPPSLPAGSQYPDTDDALRTAQDSAERYRLLILGREVRIARIGVLEAVIEACR